MLLRLAFIQDDPAGTVAGEAAPGAADIPAVLGDVDAAGPPADAAPFAAAWGRPRRLLLRLVVVGWFRFSKP
jgi:hypothetical protein